MPAIVELETRKGLEKVTLPIGFNRPGHLPKSHIDNFGHTPNGVVFDSADLLKPPLGRNELVIPITFNQIDGRVFFTTKVGPHVVGVLGFDDKGIPGGINFYLQYDDKNIPIGEYRALLLPTLSTSEEQGSRVLNEWYKLPQEGRRKYFYAGIGEIDELLPHHKPTP